jgi:putative endonuclease
MSCFVYILESLQTGRYYTGSSEKPETRLDEHNLGKVDSTKASGPWRIVHLEEYETRSEACERERYIKSRKSRAWIEKELLRKNVGL